MSPSSSSSETQKASTSATQHQQHQYEEQHKNNGFGIPPIVIFGMMIATSAGFTLYTKRASSMLRTMEEITERQHIRNPPKFGPPTKEEWEKLRPRWEKDDI